jgi:FAD binding domain
MLRNGALHNAVGACMRHSGACLAQLSLCLLDDVLAGDASGNCAGSRRAVSTSADTCDVAIVGAGHNGLVAATLLARQGLQVRLRMQQFWRDIASARNCSTQCGHKDCVSQPMCCIYMPASCSFYR